VDEYTQRGGADVTYMTIVDDSPPGKPGSKVAQTGKVLPGHGGSAPTSKLAKGKITAKEKKTRDVGWISCDPFKTC